MNQNPRHPLTLLLPLVLVTCTARALLIMLQGGYAGAGMVHAAFRSFSRHFLDGLIPCLLVAALILLVQSRLHGRFTRLLLGATTLVLADLFIVGRLPHLPAFAPEFETSRGMMAHIGGFLAAIFCSLLIASEWIRLRVPTRVLSGIAVLFILLSSTILLFPRATTATEANPPNVILISLDTLRPDHLGLYGYEKETSPNLDLFASEGLIFDNAFCNQPWTLTSHMSLLTSLLPSVHGLDNDRRLPRGVKTLADRFRAQGYDTAAIVDTVVYLHPRFGFSRGFDLYRRVYGGAVEKNGVIEEIVQDLKPGPFFLFCHYYDPHSDRNRLPYESQPEDMESFAGWYEGDFTGCDDNQRCASQYLIQLNQSGTVLGDEERRYLISLYDAGIRTLDRNLGQLFQTLEDAGVMENTVVVVTADHGEEFFEHGNVLHGQYFDEVMRVPLIIRAPGLSGPARVRDPVSLIDVAPTVAELCALDLEGMQGASLVPQMMDSTVPRERPYVILDYGDGNLGIRTANEKLVRRGGGRWQLFDLKNDPLEQHGTYPENLPTSLQSYRTLEKKQVDELLSTLGASEPANVMSEEALQNLRELGYIGD